MEIKNSKFYHELQTHPIRVREFQQKESCPISAILWHRKSYLNPAVYFLWEKTFLFAKPLRFSIFNDTQGFMTFSPPQFYFLNRRKKRRMAVGAQMGRSSLCSIYQVRGNSLSGKKTNLCYKLWDSSKCYLVTNITPNIKIYLVLKAFYQLRLVLSTK